MERDKERLLQATHDARLVHINEQVLMPMLQQRIDQAVSMLCNDLKAGLPPNIAFVAQMSAAKDLMTDLQAISRRGESAANKLHKEGTI